MAQIDQISEILGGLKKSIDHLTDQQNKLVESDRRQHAIHGEKLDRLNNSMISVKINQDAFDNRLKNHEKEFASFRGAIEGRINPLEGLRKTLIWGWSVVAAAAAVLFSGAVNRVLSVFS